MDSITTTPIPSSDIPINQGNNRAISRRLSARFPSPNDAMYPDDIANELGRRNKSLNRNSSKAHRGSANTQFDPSTSEDRDEDEDKGKDEEESVEETKEEEGPVRMSLMALLAESEEGSSYMMGEGEDDDEDEEEDGGDVGGDQLNNCCVCQVRHKGVAFVPCGHSFCRLCSRELWVEGGNCPLCDNFILEILDIF